jgi:hypothetical protein
LRSPSRIKQTTDARGSRGEAYLQMEAEVPDGLVTLVDVFDDPREQKGLSFEVRVLHRSSYELARR